MLELGQPLHAYDADRIGGREIIVRYAAKGERARTLDGVERVLTPEVLVIADKDDVIGLAGVMGGETSEVTESTTSIVLESAHFDQGVIRRGAKSLGLSTEASYRFERVVDPELPPVAMARAIDLLVEYASVERPRSIVDSNTGLRPVPTLSMRMSRAKDVLGVSLPKAFVADKLRRLGFGVVSDGETVHATVPSWRADLSREIDLVEEVGRLWGYDRLPETLPAGSLRGADSPSGSFERHLRSMLTGVGLTECFSHTLGAVSAFDDSEALAHRITVRSALSSDLSGLRTSLLPGLIGAIGLNLRNKQHDIRLFEIGKVFDTPNPGEYREHRSVSAALCGEAIDYFSAKGVAEAILSDLGLLHGITWKAVARGGYHPGRCAEILVDGRCVGMVGETDPDIARQSLDLQQGLVRIACLELDADVLADLSRALPVPRYAEPPRFPSVVRDIAMVYGDNVPYQDISDCIVRSAGDLAKTVSLLSVFTGDRIGEGKKSVALRLVMRSPERTLTDADVDTVMDGVRSALETQLNAVGR
jgi:phenylalanyl-tRNA synthetase beta chain